MGRLMLATWKRLCRNKFNLFWILAFPIILGTFFNIAFSNIGKSENMKAIAVAVICEDDEYGKLLKESATSLSEGDDPFLDATFCTEEKAMELLEEQEIVGIIHSGKQATLTISASMTPKKLYQSILQAFVEQFNLTSDMLLSVMKEHPENLPLVLSEMDAVHTFNEEVSLQKNPNVDTYTQYYYNQIAMACLYAAMAGVLVAVENQANLSTLAARKNISSTKKSVAIIAELIASTVFEFLMNLGGFIYLAYVLKVGVDTQLPYALLALFVGVWTGVSLGFLIGSIGKSGKDEKSGILFAITMPLCFLSGLMIGNMRIIIDRSAPIINKINPAALITDSFYCLSIYEGHTRYAQDLVSLLVLSLIFTGIGITLTRRTKYASI